MRQGLHKCVTLRDPLLFGLLVPESATRCVEDPLALAKVRACARAAAVRGTAWGGAGARTFTLRPSSAPGPRQPPRGPEVTQSRGLASVVGCTRIQRRDSPWAVWSWLSKLGTPPALLPAHSRAPQAPAPALSARLLQAAAARWRRRLRRRPRRLGLG